jgi:hypothetical protein
MNKIIRNRGEIPPFSSQTSDEQFVVEADNEYATAIIVVIIWQPKCTEQANT